MLWLVSWESKGGKQAGVGLGTQTTDQPLLPPHFVGSGLQPGRRPGAEGLRLLVAVETKPQHHS